MMKACKCGSYAINHHCHGRDGSDDDLCDVCYWRKRAEQPAQHEPVKHELQCICGCSWEIDADGNEELVSSPPAQRTWVGLSEEDREQHRNDWYSNIHDKEFRAIEAKLRSKNEDRN